MPQMVSSLVRVQVSVLFADGGPVSQGLQCAQIKAAQSQLVGAFDLEKGDSLSVWDLQKFGLPPLELKVVEAEKGSKGLSPLIECTGGCGCGAVCCYPFKGHCGNCGICCA